MSTPYDRYQEIDAILRRALEADGSARDDLVRVQCGDDEALLGEIEKLLARVEESGKLDPVFRLSSAFLEGLGDETVIGTSLAHYQITARLGEGGMGEVYRATDTKLGREVAIKVLPASFADDRERLSRFEREARVLATLNHPNIAQIHGFDEDEGTHFLVMELAEGETLADRLKRGAIPVDEAIPIALQICEALEAAHEQGIVHRDLKPANVHVSAETSMAPKVKVLDFGLAKAMAPSASSGADLTNSPTLTQPTAAGVLLGTAAYMSPEQARGQPADERSDIWAFGCVFYEMLTGQRAFEGRNVSDVLATVLKDEPDWARLPGVPPLVRRALFRCCEKNPAERWHHVRDVSLELASPVLFEEVNREPAAASGRGRWIVGLLFSGLLGLMVGWIGYRMTSEPALDGGVIRAEISAPLPGDGFQLWLPSLSISGDGRRLAVSGRTEGGPSGLYVKDVADRDWRALGNAKQASAPVLSPAGRWVLFYDAESGNWLRMPFSGGGSEVLASGTGNDSPWREGLQAFQEADGLLRSPWPDRKWEGPKHCDDVPGLCRQYEPAAALSGQVAIIDSSDPVLPLGETTNRPPALWRSEKGDTPTLLLENAKRPRIAGDRLLFLRGNEIWAARLKKDATLAGPALPTGVRVYQSGNRDGPGHYDVSSSGTLFYLEAIPPSQLWRLDDAGRAVARIPLNEPLEGGGAVTIKVSPDGVRALVSNGGQMRVVSLESGQVTRSFPGMTGAWIDATTFAHHRGADETLDIRDFQGRLLKTISFGQPATWSLDAVDPLTRTALLTTPDVGNLVASSQSHGLLLVVLDGRRPNQMWYDAQGLDRHTTLAPDRSFAAWESVEPSHQIQISAWGGPPDPVPVSSNGGVVPRFSKDSKRLFFVNQDRSKIMGVELRPGETPPFSAPKVAFDLPKGTIITQRIAYDTLPGGGFLVAIAEQPSRHRLIVNWLQEVDDLLDRGR